MRRTDPVENLRSYVMATGGIQKDFRMIDLEWVTEVIECAKEVDFASVDRTSQRFFNAVDRLKEVLRRG